MRIFTTSNNLQQQRKMETNASNNVGKHTIDHDIELLEDAISVVQQSLDRLHQTRQRLFELRNDITTMVEKWNEVFDELKID